MGAYFTADVLDWLGLNGLMILIFALIWIPTHKHKQKDDES